VPKEGGGEGDDRGGQKETYQNTCPSWTSKDKGGGKERWVKRRKEGNSTERKDFGAWEDPNTGRGDRNRLFKNRLRKEEKGAGTPQEGRGGGGPKVNRTSSGMGPGNC